MLFNLAPISESEHFQYLTGGFLIPLVKRGARTFYQIYSCILTYCCRKDHFYMLWSFSLKILFRRDKKILQFYNLRSLKLFFPSTAHLFLLAEFLILLFTTKDLQSKVVLKGYDSLNLALLIGILQGKRARCYFAVLLNGYLLQVLVGLHSPVLGSTGRARICQHCSRATELPQHTNWMVVNLPLSVELNCFNVLQALC